MREAVRGGNVLCCARKPGLITLGAIGHEVVEMDIEIQRGAVACGIKVMVCQALGVNYEDRHQQKKR